MPKFYVRVKEVHHQMYRVEADDPAEARRAVQRGGGISSGELEYSFTLDSDECEVYDEAHELITL